MKLSYVAKIVDKNKKLKKAIFATIKIYRSAIKYMLKILDKEYIDIKDLKNLEQAKSLENLIHSTSKNTAKYEDFDKLYYKMPCYIRRELIRTSLGIYSSWYSNYQTWLKSDKSTKPPKLIYNHNQMPVFYKGNMYEELNDGYVKLKLYSNNDWAYFIVKLNSGDLKYFNKYKDWTKSNPVLEKNGKIFSLRFCFKKDITRSNTPLKKQKVLGVDLNVKNTSAVCSVINIDGTVISRKFINCGKEKDHLNKMLQIKKACQKRNCIKSIYLDELYLYNYNNYRSYYRRIDYANKELAIQIARQIVNFAINENVDVIVFEHLDKKGKKSFLKEKLHFWNCKAVQNITASLAHKNGIHVNTICACGTSKLAYDGSGEVSRHSSNRSICTFTTGKVYNCDLNASYNIASRYFIKEIQKSISEKKWLEVVTKVSSASKRSTCTLDTLIKLRKVLSSPADLTVLA